MENNRPNGRRKNVIGQGSTIHKRDDAVNTNGPVGRKDGYAGKKPGSSGTQQFSSEQGEGSGGSFLRTTRGKGSIGGILIVAVLIFLAWKLGLCSNCGSLLGNLGGGQEQVTEAPSNNQSGLLSGVLGSLVGGSSDALSTFTNGGTVSTGWTNTNNTGKLDDSVASEARAKRTQILGNNQDKVTIMVYMCGTDLESKYGMGSNDLQEMINAGANNPNLNLIVYTGGCSKWKNSVVSSQYNQIYKIGNGGVARLVENDGKDSMTKPATLTRFINFCTTNFPANRYELILWDHGGGSVSGYGYDEKYSSSGSMSLKGINEALKASNTTFDFIGFDACLMATLENALMLESYADYLIASEETEPGVGWYYTNWLKNLSNNTSMPTLEIGRQIVDDFVSECDRTCQGQKTTLSVTDLAELGATVEPKFNEFAAATTELIKTDYKKVSDARNSSREFATSSKIDQIDLVHLARNLGTDEANALADAILKAVKYNKTSSNMTNCYGLSIFFPYRKSSMVDSAVSTYKAIGLDNAYSRCIQQFASMGVAGQAAGSYASTGSISSSSPYTSLTGGSGEGTLSSGGVTDLLGSLLGGSGSGDLLSGLLGGSGSFFGKSMPELDGAADYVAAHQFDSSKLVWAKDGDTYTMTLPEDQWELVHGLLLNVFVNDGKGYIDLGMDNYYEFTNDGKLKGEYDKTWLGIDGQAVAYYFMDEVRSGSNYTITGRVPC
ncbi:MAG: peptidase C11, partial [Clostridia bacterium]|nr:peptidase C11 [Clostridia bacterium]